MRKRIAFLLAVLLLLALPVVPRAEADTTTVRVLLGTDSKSVEIAVKGTYSVGDTTFTGGTLTAKINNGTITVSHSEKGTLAAGTKPVRVVRAEADKDAANLTLTNKGHNAKLTYLGDLIFSNNGGSLQTVNAVGLHEYLYGVVSGEVTNSSPDALIRTEAICAKCYVLADWNPNSTKSFDVYDTTKSQLYYGYKAADTNVIRAVDEVWENTLLCGGKVVKTYYCTANGGQMITPKMHWGGGTATDAAYGYGYDPFDLAANSKNVILDVDGKNPSAMNAKVLAYFVSLAEKTVDEPVDAIESIVSLSGVYDAKNPNGTSRYPADFAPHVKSSITMNVRTQAGSFRQVQADFTLADLKSKVGISASGSMLFTVHTAQQKWKIVYGVSSGHRVGLSHRGAGQMAKKGYSYVDILKFYFPGATLTDAAGNAILSTATFDFTYTGVDPAATPEPTAEPEITPEPSETPEPTDTPEPETTDTPEPEATDTPEPEAADTPEPEATETPEPEATDTPEPEITDTPEPEAPNTPEPTDTPEPTATPDLKGYLLGDVDGFNGITRADALLVLRYVLGLETLTEDQLVRADANGDGKVSAADASAILRILDPRAAI